MLDYDIDDTKNIQFQNCIMILQIPLYLRLLRIEIVKLESVLHFKNKDRIIDLSNNKKNYFGNTDFSEHYSIQDSIFYLFLSSILNSFINSISTQVKTKLMN